MSANRSRYTFYKGDVLDVYDTWESPDVIISDGAYGINGFDGDTSNVHELPSWYAPHIEAWSKKAKFSTSLWFWNTEIGWASVHSLLEQAGWEYIQSITWDKGLAHIAGNVNGDTIRQFPVVSEVSVLYRRRVVLESDSSPLYVKEWLRHEWMRSGLPLNLSNDACGVKNAASRKYLTKDDLWYWPPGEQIEKMGIYANQKGKPTSRPYFSVNGIDIVRAEEWDAMRSVWHHRNGITNVWARPPLSDKERYKGSMIKAAPRSKKATNNSATHLNQKPIEFMERQIYATTNEGDVVWEPFGGLVSASCAALQIHRYPYTAEINEQFQTIAEERLMQVEMDMRERSKQ